MLLYFWTILGESMNRAFRFFFGPMGFFMFTLGFCTEYMKYAKGKDLISGVLTIICTAVFVMALPTLLALLYQCVKYGDDSPLALWPVVRMAFFINVLTHGTAKLWLWMATSHPSQGIFIVIAVFTVIAMILLPITLVLLVRVFGKTKEKEKKTPEKPSSVRTRIVKSRSGFSYEETTSYFGKKSVTSMKLLTA